MLTMLIYAESIHPRFQYAALMVLSQLNGKISFTTNQQEYDQYNGPKIYYGHELKEGFTVKCSNHLWNNQINIPQVKAISQDDVIHLWFGDDGFFDVFTATFFMLSRMEEYQNDVLDEHGRFKSENAAMRSGRAYHKPWVDIWRLEFEQKLKSHFSELSFNQTSFEIHPTIDVDSAFAYQHKGFIRTIGGFAKDLVAVKLENAWHRLMTVVGLKHDPYNTYDQAIMDVREKNLIITWFFLLSDYSKENINISPSNGAMKRLIQRLSQHHIIGIHPGYHRDHTSGELKKEILRLREITGVEVKQSRQHYLRTSLPATYHMLIHENITDDYTMGFADDYGYRAGTAMPFPWFDLTENKTTSLRIHPFVVMDTTLKNYLKLSPDEAINVIHLLREQCRNLNLPFEFLWHNESLSEHHSWKGWYKVWKSIF